MMSFLFIATGFGKKIDDTLDVFGWYVPVVTNLP